MSLTIEMDLNAWSEGGHRQMVFCSWPFLGRFQNVLSKSQPDRRLEFPQMVRSSPMSAHKGYRSIKAFFFLSSLILTSPGLIFYEALLCVPISH